MNINQTTTPKPNRKERRAMERRIRKEIHNSKTMVVPTAETGVFAVYVPVKEQEQPKEKTSPTPPSTMSSISSPLYKKLKITTQEADDLKKHIVDCIDCYKTMIDTYSSLIERLTIMCDINLQQQLTKTEAAINVHHAANVIASELEFPLLKNYLDADIRASQRNTEEFKTYVQALMEECKQRFNKLSVCIEKLDTVIFKEDEGPWIVSDETINKFMQTEQKRLSDLLVEKENRRAEAARQAEIDSLLARLKELGYKSEQPESEFFVTVERREEVVPVISITMNNRQLSITIDEACQKVKSWYASLPKHSSIKLWDQGYDEQEILDYLKLIEQISFIKKKGRVDLFREDFEWSYSAFLNRFGKLLQKHNIKMWAKQKLTFDHR